MVARHKADSRLGPSQWEKSLQSIDVSHWLGANLESALDITCWPRRLACQCSPASHEHWLGKCKYMRWLRSWGMHVMIINWYSTCYSNSLRAKPNVSAIWVGCFGPIVCKMCCFTGNGCSYCNDNVVSQLCHLNKRNPYTGKKHPPPA